ncbi:Venom carboxylesterase-6 [Frankliniella fusca]|uniref:Venom carboxylesterase-6 n=1 Tax=Frankliniella fusca TaxID=407009 RepID=A0AAE1H0M2_9NEOP|nr:Venom carboxylesterase-6 [Frankliniella fusca]
MSRPASLSWVSVLLVTLLLAAAALADPDPQQGEPKRGKTVKKQLRMEEAAVPDEDGPEVKLGVGWLNGRWMRTRAGRRVAAFTAVPYAKPPVGDLRFKAPVPAEPWTGARDSPPLESVPVCMQHKGAVTTRGMRRDEDCLYLNVFTPKPSNGTLDGTALPVLVWLHGGELGSFNEGGSGAYGPEYLLDRELVLVTVNYRLGALGFLSTGDAAASGNWGLKDQQLALRWVRDHIAALGGDPARVTLAGQGAGAVSAHCHIMARSSGGLFHRAVSLGGSALSAGLPMTGAAARRLALRLGAALGCREAREAVTEASSAKQSAELVSCLRGKPARDLVAPLEGQGLCPLVTWGPVVEGGEHYEVQEVAPFLDAHPVDTLTSGLALDVPWLAGVNINEGGLWAAAIQGSKQLEVFDSNMNTMAPVCLGFNDTARPEELPDIMQEIREFYFGTNNLTRENLYDLSNMFTDGVVLAGLDEAMRLHAAYLPAAAPAYLCVLSHRGQRSAAEAFGQRLGVVHGDDLYHLFPMGGEQDSTDAAASEKFIDLLVSFAVTGNPTPEDDKRYAFPWKPVESEELEFIEFAQNGRLLQGAGLLGHRAHFWSALPISERNVKNMQASERFTRNRDEF